MAELALEWRALSIRQPWVDLILSGQKTVEIRLWEHAPRLRGPFLLHAARAIDWKTVELLQDAAAPERPRGGFVGVAELVEVIPVSDATNWRELLMQHRVVHPPPNDRTVWGLRLHGARAFERTVKGLGDQYFFPVPRSARGGVARQLERLGIDPATVRLPELLDGGARVPSLQTRNAGSKERLL